MTEPTERDLAICQSINDVCLRHMGISRKSDEGINLSQLTLREMLDAVERVEAAPETVNSDGSKSITLRPDPRLIAATYVLYNYDASRSAIISRPLVREERFQQPEDDVVALVVVSIPTRKANDGEGA